tara:strand:- start:214 stop:822 length:609 start_codon:yes stop_codon:yes gene_type:complete
MATQTFELVSPFLTIYAPSKKFSSAQSSLLLGQTSNRLVTGELLSYTGANGVERSATHGIEASNLNGFTKFCAPYFSETGRGDIITGGNVPVLQFGPFEADTMCFMRVGDDDASISSSAGVGSLAGGAHTGFAVGEKVFACAVRNPLNGDTFDANNYIIGVAPASGLKAATLANAICVGRVSRIDGLGSGASQKIRIMFGVN